MLFLLFQIQLCTTIVKAIMPYPLNQTDTVLFSSHSQTIAVPPCVLNKINIALVSSTLVTQLLCSHVQNGVLCTVFGVHFKEHSSKGVSSCKTVRGHATNLVMYTKPGHVRGLKSM